MVLDTLAKDLAHHVQIRSPFYLVCTPDHPDTGIFYTDHVVIDHPSLDQPGLYQDLLDAHVIQPRKSPGCWLAGTFWNQHLILGYPDKPWGHTDCAFAACLQPHAPVLSAHDTHTWKNGPSGPLPEESLHERLAKATLAQRLDVDPSCLYRSTDGIIAYQAPRNLYAFEVHDAQVLGVWRWA